MSISSLPVPAKPTPILEHFIGVVNQFKASLVLAQLFGSRSSSAMITPSFLPASSVVYPASFAVISDTPASLRPSFRRPGSAILPRPPLDLRCVTVVTQYNLLLAGNPMVFRRSATLVVDKWDVYRWIGGRESALRVQRERGTANMEESRLLVVDGAEHAGKVSSQSIVVHHVKRTRV